jgi:hypothetical protein
MVVMRKSPIQARSASEGKAVPRWRSLKLRFLCCYAKKPDTSPKRQRGKSCPSLALRACKDGASAPRFQLLIFGLEPKAQLQNWRFGLVGMVLTHLGFNCEPFGPEQKAQLQNWRFGLVSEQTSRNIFRRLPHLTSFPFP